MLTVSSAAKRVYQRRREVVIARDETQVLARGQFDCNEKQYDFVTDRTFHTVAMIGGIGSGKTWALTRGAALKQHEERGTGTIGGLFANTHEQLNTATLPHLWEYYEQLGMTHGDDYVFNEAPPRYWRRFESRFKKKYNNVISVRRWGQMVARSLDNYEDIRGIEIGHGHIDEARGAEEAAFDVILGRIRCPRCSFLMLRMATSPNGYDWVHQKMVDDPAKKKALRSLRRAIFTRSAENTFLPPGYLDQLRASYDPKQAEQEIEGKIVLLTQGLVYHQFNRATHVGHFRPSPRLGWEVCWDFNRTPFSVILCQTVMPENPGARPVVYAIDEVVMNDAGTVEMCREVIKRISRDNCDQGGEIRIYGDASGNQRDTKSKHSDYDIIRRTFGARYGSRAVACWPNHNPPVLSRYNAVNAMLRNGNGDISYYVDDRCETLKRDYERVVFKPGTSDADKTTDKRLTHASDAVGYYIAKRFPVRKPTAGRINV